jgi:hypothetical protein
MRCIVGIHFQGGRIMARVTREMVEKSGVNVDQLVELLVKNASAPS